MEAPGKDTIIKAVVDDKGEISLPYVKEPVRVKDLTCAKVEEAVAKAYRDARLIVETVVKVVIAKDAKEQKPAESPGASRCVRRIVRREGGG